MKKITVIFGTRPEAIKMCPLVKELKNRKNFEVSVCVSGQHEALLSDVLNAFEIIPKYNLSLMRQGQNLSELTSKAIDSISRVLMSERPDTVLVHGDTTTAFSAALAAFYCGADIGHIEAGLRTYNIFSPYPEEFNRRAISLVSKYHFAPTESAKENLLSEGYDESHIFVTGNTAIDALRTTVREDYTHPALDAFAGYKIIMLTLHRRESIGTPMRNVFRALRRIAKEHKDVCIIYPVHPNPRVRKIAHAELCDCERILLTEPLGVLDFHNFLARCYMTLTDSGGIQEEAPHLGKPVLVARNTTERPEGISAGTARLIGCKEVDVYQSVKLLLDDSSLYSEMAQSKNPYGDGFASSRIADILLNC